MGKDILARSARGLDSTLRPELRRRKSIERQDAILERFAIENRRYDGIGLTPVRERIVRMRRLGVPISDLGAEYGLSNQRITQIELLGLKAIAWSQRHGDARTKKLIADILRKEDTE